MADDFGAEFNILTNVESSLDPMNKALGETIDKLKTSEQQVKEWESEWQKGAAKAKAYGEWKAKTNTPLDGTERLEAWEREWSKAAYQARVYADWKKKAGGGHDEFGAGGGISATSVATGNLIAAGLEKVVSLAVDAARGVYNLGEEFVRAAGRAQDLELAIKLDVGDAGAEQIADLGKSFERTSRFSGEQIKQQLLPLLEQGLTDKKQLDDLATAATDIAARRGGGIEQVGEALEAFRKIALKGEIDARALRELAISQPAFYKDLANLLHTDAKSAEALTKEGKVTSKTLLSVALNQIAQREGGALGKATVEASKTLGGTLARLGNLKESAFAELANSDGIRRVQGVLDNFVEVMSGPVGHELITSLGEDFDVLIKSVFGDLEGADGVAKMENALKHLKATASEWADDFRRVWPAVKADIEAVVKVTEALVAPLVAYGKALIALHEYVDAHYSNDTVEGGIALGKNAQGFNQTLSPTDIAGLLERAGVGKDFRRSSVLGVANYKGASVPGGGGFLGVKQITEEEAQRIALEQFRKEQPSDAGAPVAAAAKAAAANGANSTQNNTLNLTVHGGDGSKVDPHEMVQHVEEGWHRLLDRMRYQSGAAAP